jgi:acyl-CoA dehydrogenase
MKRVADRALQIHGSFGISDEAPFMHMIANAYHVGLADGPTEVHKATMARLLLKDAKPAEGVFPSYTRSIREAKVRERYADLLKLHGRL